MVSIDGTVGLEYIAAGVPKYETPCVCITGAEQYLGHESVLGQTTIC